MKTYNTGYGYTFEERFWSKVAIKRDTNACWEWQASVNQRGYGRSHATIEGRYTQHAHRIAYYLYFGVNPGDSLVCHHCDNPPCCNPTHLFLGSPQDNIADMVQKKRHFKNLSPGEPYRNRPRQYGKLTLSSARRLKQKLAAGESPTKLARENKISPRLVFLVKAGERWARA